MTESIEITDQSQDRVRENSSAEINARLDREAATRVRKYAASNDAQISQRIEELDQEWDMERLLETNASAIGGMGVALALTTRNKKWLIVPGIVLPFLFLHAVQGWCPPVPLFRRLGVRTRKEIDREKYALKALRGDFQQVSTDESEQSRAAKALAAVNA